MLVSPDIKYQAAYLFSGDKKHSVFCLSFVYTLELVNKETYVPTEVLIFHLRETGKKKFQKHTLLPSYDGGGGRGGEKVVVQGEVGITCWYSNPSSYLNPSPLYEPHPPTMNIQQDYSCREDTVPFLPATIVYVHSFIALPNHNMKRACEMKGNSNAMFQFHFWHHMISNLNGYQEQISSYSPAPSYQVLMQMHPICYLEWRCLVLKDADSLCEKSFSPANEKGTKWDTKQTWED